MKINVKLPSFLIVKDKWMENLVMWQKVMFAICHKHDSNSLVSKEWNIFLVNITITFYGHTTGLSDNAESLKNCSTWARSAAKKE